MASILESFVVSSGKHPRKLCCQQQAKDGLPLFFVAGDAHGWCPARDAERPVVRCATGFKDGEGIQETSNGDADAGLQCEGRFKLC